MQTRNASQVYEGCEWQPVERYSGSEQPCWVEASAFRRLASGDLQHETDSWLSWLSDPTNDQSAPVVACLTPRALWTAGADPTQHPYRWILSGVAATALAAYLLCYAFRRSCRPWLAVYCAPSAGSLQLNQSWLNQPSVNAKDAIWNVERVTDHLCRCRVQENLEEISFSGMLLGASISNSLLWFDVSQDLNKAGVSGLLPDCRLSVVADPQLDYWHVARLGEALRECSMLRSLDLSHCGLSQSAIRVLVNALGSQSFFASDSASQPLIWMNLRGNQLGDMAEELAKIFRAAPQLGTMLGLEVCCDGGKVLPSAIDWKSERVEWGQTLLLATELRANRLGLDCRRIHLSQNCLTTQLGEPDSHMLGMEELCRSLTGQEDLQQLDLMATGIGDVSLACLAAGLLGGSRYGQLCTIDLSGNSGISVRGATALAEALPSSSLKQLIVGCDQRLTIPLHYDGVHGHPSLGRSTSLDLSSGGVTPIELILLAAALPTLKISRLDMSHNVRLKLQDSMGGGTVPAPPLLQPLGRDSNEDEPDGGNELALVLPLAGKEQADDTGRSSARPEDELLREMTLAEHRLKLAEAQLTMVQPSLPDVGNAELETGYVQRGRELHVRHQVLLLQHTEDDDPSVHRAVLSHGLSTQVPAHWLTFSRALTATVLEDLKLESCGIGPASAFALSFDLPRTLTHLSLRGNPLTRNDWDVRGVAALGNAIHAEGQPVFKQLDLTDCDLGKKAKAAMRATRSGNRGGTHWMWRW